jgi:hypothetical protein
MNKPIDPKLAKFIAESKIKERLYHGTMKDVKEFRTPAYFGSKDVANQFADPEYMFGSSELNEGERPNVMPVHLNLKNPKVFTKESDYEKHVMDGGLNTKHWLKKGHDGIIYAPGGDMTHPDAYYVAFHPTQIKSAIGNRGTYDPNDPDITKADGGQVPSPPSADMLAKLMQLRDQLKPLVEANERRQQGIANMEKANGPLKLPTDQKAKGGRVTHAHHLQIEERPL